ncbi:MAG: hypothetical protein ABIX12_01305 [Rubrivivax sp.]
MDWNFRPPPVRDDVDARWYLVPLGIMLAVLCLALLTEWVDPPPAPLDSRAEQAMPEEAPGGA